MTIKSETRTTLAADTAYWTLTALATRWGVSLKTVRRLAAAGDLPVTRVGRAVRVAARDLAAFEALRRA